MNPIDDQDPRQEILPFEDSFDLDLKPLDPLTEPSNLIPVRDDFTEPPRPRSEDEDTWASQKKPWIPDLGKDIKPFDDLFDVIDNTFADARTGAGAMLKCSLLVPTVISVMVIYMWA